VSARLKDVAFASAQLISGKQSVNPGVVRTRRKDRHVVLLGADLGSDVEAVADRSCGRRLAFR